MYAQVWYKLLKCKGISIFVGGTRTHTHSLPRTILLKPLNENKFYHTFTYNRRPVDEPSDSKHVEDNVKINTLVLKRCILFIYVIQLYDNAQCKNVKYSPGIQAGIATGYGLDGPGSNPGRGEIFRTRTDRPWGPPSFLYNGYRVFPTGKAAGAWC
jgi:hypothetical protein